MRTCQANWQLTGECNWEEKEGQFGKIDKRKRKIKKKTSFVIAVSKMSFFKKLLPKMFLKRLKAFLKYIEINLSLYRPVVNQ